MTFGQTSRAFPTAIFRRVRLFLAVFVAVNLVSITYLLVATPKYESSAQLLFRFGPDRRPAARG